MWVVKNKRAKADLSGGNAKKKAGSGSLRILGLPNNDIQLESAGSVGGSIKIVKGKGNVIRFGSGSRFAGSIHIVGNNNVIEIGVNADIKGRIIVKGSRQRVVIGEGTTSKGVRLLCSEDCHITIGNHCVFLNKIEIRTSDAHSVVDRETGNRLNPAAPVTIGNHVRVGAGAVINKGASIASDSIVEAMSFVNRVFAEEGVVLAGVPAKVTLSGIARNR